LGCKENTAPAATNKNKIVNEIEIAKETEIKLILVILFDCILKDSWIMKPVRYTYLYVVKVTGSSKLEPELPEIGDSEGTCYITRKSCINVY